MKRRSPFGELIRQYRRHLGMSQEALARHINDIVDAGGGAIENRISSKTIYNHEAEWEDATRFAVPRVATIGTYADAFGLKPGTSERQALIDAAEETRRLRDHVLASPDPPPTLSSAIAPPRSSGFVVEGREQPWDTLQRALAAALAGQPRVILLEGEAGIGKSRLLAELGRQAERASDRSAVAWGRCFAPNVAPYHAIREVLRLLIGDLQSAGTSRLLSPETADRLRARAPDAIDALLSAGPALIGSSLVDLDLLRASAATFLPNDDIQARLDRVAARPVAIDPGTIHDQVAATLSLYAAPAPFVLVIDDLHYATPATLECLALLARVLRDAADLPFLLAGAYRPEAVREEASAAEPSLATFLRDIQRQWPEAVIDLGPSIDSDHGRAYIDGRLDLTPNQLDAPFRDALFARTGGLPFFVENALWTLQASGQVRQDQDGVLILRGSLDDLDLSPTISAMIGERLAGLDPRAREALELACVQGEQFFADPVIAIMQLSVPAAARLFDTELRRQARLIMPAGVITVAGTRLHRYQFAHALYRDFLFEHLGILQREHHQAATAAALDARAGATHTEVSATIADLYEQAGEQARAVHHHRLAGTYDLDIWNPASAHLHFERTIALADRRTQAEEIGQAMLGVIRGLRMIGDRRRAIDECQDALAFSRANHLPAIEAYALIWQGLMLYDRGDSLAAEETLVVALPLLHALGDMREESRAEGLLAHVLYSLGRYDDTVAHADRALDLATEIGDDELAGESRLAVANCLLDLGLYDDAVATFAQAIARYRRVKGLRGEAMCRADIGLGLIGLEDWSRATDALHDARTLAEQIVAFRIVGHVELYQGLADEGRGDRLAAAASYGTSLRLRRQSGQHGFAMDALAGLLRVNLARRREWYTRRIVWGIGRYLAAHGAEGIEEPFRVAESCVAALEALGEPALAERLLREAVALLRERAARLSSPAHRESYLRRVAANRALLERASRLPAEPLSGKA